MDSATRADVAQKAMIGGGMSPNEVRKRYHGLGPVKGGQSPYLQEQQFSLAALDERDQDKPFSKPAKPPPGPPANTPPPQEPDCRTGKCRWRRGTAPRFAAEIYHRAAQFDARDAA